MYIWAAIDIDNQLIKQKEIVQVIEDEIQFKESNVSNLPLHVSLKISSEVSNENEMNLRNDLIQLFKKTKPFDMEVEGIELHDTIVWIKIKENDNLKELHESICHICKDKYGIALHEFDKCFMYHSTLFLDSDAIKVKEAFMKIRTMELPKKLKANTFIIGSSLDGIIGTYKVDTAIKK